ncbi:helix-turn-helix domain-containing protein [Nonomuraea sp. NPDC059023]|uniref:AlbA family DNA-binding domain-containing protein n=1 Tax=unclassified Nonomuraea TaxID=2593643 RepID=UPI00367C55DE
MELLSRFGVPSDLSTRQGLERLISEHITETRHLDFKRQLGSPEDLADDLVAMVNSGGGILVVGVGTDRHDRASSLYPQALRTLEQQVVQAAREGVDEPIRVDPIQIPSESDPSSGYLVIAIPPSDRIPHISSKRGRILHRVGTHNKPMTRREVGASFCASGASFAREFGLMTASDPALIVGFVNREYNSQNGWIRVKNSGGSTAFNITISTTASPLMYKAPRSPEDSPFGDTNTSTPPYLPIAALPPGAEVCFYVMREWGCSDQDLLTFTWEDQANEIRQAQQSVTWES